MNKQQVIDDVKSWLEADIEGEPYLKPIKVDSVHVRSITKYRVSLSVYTTGGGREEKQFVEDSLHELEVTSDVPYDIDLHHSR